ncbi:MAG: hypothetical protein ACRDZO_15520 [Egibacteraceae bacterium]
MAIRPGDPALYVAEKGGGVRALRDGEIDPAPVLDLSDQVPTGGEQGLLGDFCAGRLLGRRHEGDRAVDLGDLGDLGVAVDGLSSFGEDQEGELYAMSLSDGGPYRLDPSPAGP